MLASLLHGKFAGMCLFNVYLAMVLPVLINDYRSLALDVGFTDLQAKLTLLSFCITHCPPEDIMDTLKERQSLEVQVLLLSTIVLEIVTYNFF